MHKSPTKLRTDERRAAILKAVLGVFAEKGIHGTTTRELAKVAGISEALMLRHFPTKEALYQAVLEASCQHEAGGDNAFAKMLGLEPSTSSLVFMVHLLFTRIMAANKQGNDNPKSLHKLLIQSVQGDGEFIRAFLKGGPSILVAKLEQCLKAAIAADEAVETPVSRTLRGWFAHHLAVSAMLMWLPDPPAVDYGVSRDKLVEQAVTFALRGMGLKDEAIKRYYNPKALALLAG